MPERIKDPDVQELATIRTQLSSARDLARRLEKREEELEKGLIERLSKGDFHPRLMTDKKNKIKAVDWEAIWEYIYKNKASSLVHKRLTDSAVEERLAAGEVIGGLETVEVTKLKILES